MNQFESSISVRGLFSGENKKPTLLLILASVIPTLFKYFGSKQFYVNNLSSVFVWFDDPARTATYFHFLSSFFWYGVVAFVVIRYVLREPLASYGIAVGDWKFGLKALAVLVPLMALMTYPSSRMPEFIAEYPLFKGAGASASSFVVHALTYLVYYAGWELFYRGLLQHGLRRYVGDWNAILIQTIASCLVHIGKPVGEILFSIPGGIVAGLIVFRTRSLWYVILLHWLLGVVLDYYIAFM
jgi:membrane protease YdiL (CAAX protease family)